MITLSKKYVIGVHVMFYEIEMFSGYVDALLNTLKTVDNSSNITLDFCFNTAQHLEKIDTNLITEDELVAKFKTELDRLSEYNVNVKYHTTNDRFYYHADYRRDLNYHYCKLVDFVLWGETDSFFPKETFNVIESLAQHTDSQGIYRYILSFSDRKMWDASWDVLVHSDFESYEYDHNEDTHFTNPNQAKSPMSIDRMNEINLKSTEFDFRYINYPKISGACLVLSSDLIKSGVNVPSCLIYNDDEGLSILAQKLQGQNYLQFVCKNILHVHARRHPKKRLYVAGEDNPHSFIDSKNDNFQKFKQMSKHNISSLITGKDKFYEYKDF